jgi:hypothetical protein
MIARLAPSGAARFLMPKARFALPVALLVAVFALTAGVGTADAATRSECAKKLLNDYYDGRIDNTYPVHCYREAINSLPEDVKVYGSAREDITRALLAAFGIHNPPGGGKGGSALKLPSWVGPNTKVKGRAIPGSKKDETFFGRLASAIGPGNASSIPLPLLILAGVGLLLVAAAGASYTARWIQARRAHPQPATSPPTPRRK